MDGKLEPLYVGTAPVFEVDLHGFGSVVYMDGHELKCVQSVRVDQPLDGPPTVTITFVASQVTGLSPERKAES